MEKKIEDYLHFYPKVPILICEPGVEPVSHYLEGIDWYGGHAIAERVNYSPSWIRPILRPLSDMAEEEGKEAEAAWNSARGLGAHVSANLTICDAVRIKYLLSKHFDLFGLIESGLAIDSTKQPAPVS